jgi:hypothetical protein
LGLQEKNKEISTVGLQERRKLKKKKTNNKKDKTLDELENALTKENKFYSNLGRIRLFIRVSIYIITTLGLCLFDVLNLNETLLLFLGLTFLEYLKFSSKL